MKNYTKVNYFYTGQNGRVQLGAGYHGQIPGNSLLDYTCEFIFLTALYYFYYILKLNFNFSDYNKFYKLDCIRLFKSYYY